MKTRIFVSLLLLVCFVQNAYCYNYITWQAQKGHDGYWDYVGVTVSGIKACSIKAPGMPDYIQAELDVGRNQWYCRIFYSTLSELRLNSLGEWELKLTHDNDQESIYTFTISGSFEESDFPPIATITEPAEGASNIIAEHYTISWDSNGAEAVATMMGVEVGGNDFFYSSYTLDPATTTWNPGWLEIGDAYFRMSYLIDHSGDMISYPSYVSGTEPEILWSFVRAYTASGVQNDFYVKYSLDLTEDDNIDLSDLAIFFSHWLETQ